MTTTRIIPSPVLKTLRKISLEAEKKRKLAKKTGILMTTLPLAACFKGGTGGDTASLASGSLAVTNFDDNGGNSYSATDDNDSVFIAEGMSESFTVVGGAGDDTITTSSGNDLIRGGEGADTINAGDGNDSIVVIGTTTAGQYTQDAITNSAGTGTDLSSVISLADLNGRTVSEVEAGEVIDGGAGNNTLFIYGTVDLTGVTLRNVDVLVVNSNVTLTPEQLAEFTTIDGDGQSILNIEVPDGAESVTLDLTQYDISDVGTLNIDGDITIIIDDISDITEIENITVEDLSQITLEIQAGEDGTTSVNLGDLGEIFERINVIDADEDCIIEVDESSDLDDLELEAIEGDCDIEDNSDGEAGDKIDEVDNTDDDVTEPTLKKVYFNIIKGDTITLTDDHIRFCMPEESQDVVTFYVTEIVHGEFRIDGVATQEFTLDHLEEGLVTFTHDGSDEQPEFGLGILWYDGETLHEGNVVGSDYVYMAEFIKDDGVYVTRDGLSATLDKSFYDGDVEVEGANGDDNISTGGGNDHVDGGDGADVISTDGGHDTIIYGAGDSVDGGEGFDSLVIEDVNLTLDLSTLDVNGVEMIDLEGAENTLTFTVQDVLDISTETQDLVIWGNEVNSINSTGQGWDYQGQDEWEGQMMNVYLMGDAQLLVDADMIQNIN